MISWTHIMVQFPFSESPQKRRKAPDLVRHKTAWNRLRTDLLTCILNTMTYNLKHVRLRDRCMGGLYHFSGSAPLWRFWIRKTESRRRFFEEVDIRYQFKFLSEFRPKFLKKGETKVENINSQTVQRISWYFRWKSEWQKKLWSTKHKMHQN